jgi:hypothetical protein
VSGRRWRADVLRAALLAAFVVVAWCAVYGRWNARQWRVPLVASHDALWWFAMEKAATEGAYTPFASKVNAHLGAPYSANWDDFPAPDELLLYAGGMLARAMGVFAAANLLVVIAQVLAAVTFYTVCRLLDCRWQWSMVGALAFGLSQFAFQRSVQHLTLTYYWHVPLGFLVCGWCASRAGLELRGWRFHASAGTALVMGLHNPYYANLFLQFLGLAALVQLFRRAPWRRVAAPLVVGTICMMALLAANVDTIRYRYLHGKNTLAFSRTYEQLELYALRPLDLFMPAPGHRLSAASDWAVAYLRDPARKTHFPGEPFAQYLGLAGIGALLWLAVLAARRAAGLAPGPVPAEALGVVWVVLYSVAGGLNGFLGQAGFPLFRCTNRYSVCILALVLLFGVRALSERTASWHSGALSGVVLIAAAIICWDQLPRVIPAGLTAGIEAQVESDRAFTVAMEQTLPRAGMVFQLPVMRYPEAQPIQRMTDYAHFRPYLFSRDLRYSYGAVKGRGLDDWQLAVERLEAPQMLAALEKFGFAAIYINRQGYADRATAMLAALAAAGRPDILESADGDLVCVLLRPAARPELPR